MAEQAGPSRQDAAVDCLPEVTDARRQTVSNTLVTCTSQAVVLVINIATIAALARLLTPSDYGLVAMVLGAMAFMRPVSDAGLSIATIQTSRLTHAQLSNLFWLNTCLGAGMALILALAAPLLAAFNSEPRLISLTLALSATFLLLGLSVQHMALLKRQMKFRTIAAIEIGSAASGFVAGLSAALMGMGYWSLVVLQLITPAAILVASWLLAGWQPGPPRRSVGTRPLVTLGASLTASSFLWALARGADLILIGRVLGVEALGLYSRAISLVNRPVEQAASPLAAVFVPTLSRLRGNTEVYRRAARDTHALLAFAGLAAAGLLLPIAAPLTAVLLGPQWSAAAPIVAALSLLVVYVPLTLVPGWILSSQGRGRDFLILSCASSTLTVAAFVAGLPYGPVGVALSFSVCALVLLLPITVYIVGGNGGVTRADLAMPPLKQLPAYFIAYAAAAAAIRVADRPAVQIGAAITFVGVVSVAWAFAYPPSRQVGRAIIDIARQSGLIPVNAFARFAQGLGRQ